MNKGRDSHRQILRSTSIIGGATVGAMFIGIVRMKLIAAMLGPAGVGLLGTMAALLAMGYSMLGMAVESSGVRQLSAASGEPTRARTARLALWLFAGLLTLLSVIVFWALQKPIASLSLGAVDYANWVGWLGPGVALTIVGGVQLAIVQSDRRIGDLARIRLLAALLAGLVSVSAIFVYGADGIILAVLAPAVATCLTAYGFHRRAPKQTSNTRPALSELRQEWKMLVTLGSTVALAATIGSVGQAGVRAILTQKLGLEAAGLFQASHGISSLNLSLLLGAMVADYYPRISAASKDPVVATQILNQQVHVGLLLAGPALIAISALAPLLLHLLYTSEFTQASFLLRLQVTADSLRVVGWALGFVLLARKMGRGYLLAELVHGLFYLPLTWLAVPYIGVAAAGAAYLIGYIVSLATVVLLTRRHGIWLDRSNSILVTLLACTLLVIALTSLISEDLAMGMGTAVFLVVAALSLREIDRIGFVPIVTPAVAFIRLHFLRSGKKP